MSVRSSILARLLMVSLAVLACSISATALITTRSTTNQIQGALDRSVANDDRVYSALLTYAETHSSWNDAQALVESLARDGRRVTVTTPTGVPIADSSPAGERSLIPSDVSAKRIDALPALMQAAATDEVDAPGVLTTATRQAILEAVSTCLSVDGVTAWRAEDGSGYSLVGISPSSPVTAQALTTCQSSAARTVLTPLVAPAALVYFTGGGVTPAASWLHRVGSLRLLLALLGVLLITVVMTLSAGRRLLRPIRSMTRATQRIAAGDRQARVRINGNDELARLGTPFNSMAESISTAERLREQLVSDVAHELRSPLANVRGYLEGAQDHIVRADGPWIDSLLEETLVLQRLIDDLQDLALADAGRLRIHPELADATVLAAHVVAAHRPLADAAGVTVALDADGPAPLLADPVRIRQVIGNLVSNALRYTPPSGAVTVAIRADATTAMVTIVVTDTGIGIEPEHLAHLFDRFYRVDGSRSRETGGSGLGLAIVRHLVEAHDGTIDVASRVGRGTTISIALPRGEPVGEAAHAGAIATH